MLTSDGLLPTLPRLGAPPAVHSEEAVKVSQSLTAAERREWDLLAGRHPNASVGSSAGITLALARALAVPAIFVSARYQGRLVGTWSSVRVGLPFRRRLVSLPLYESGGPLLADGAQVSTAVDMATALCAYAAQHGIQSVEFRAVTGDLAPAILDLAQTGPATAYARLTLGDPEHLFRTKLDHQVRKAIRKAESAGITTDERHDPDSLRRDFYPLYLAWMKSRHGAPPLPLELFLGFARELGENLRVFYARAGGKPVAALLGYVTGQRVYISQIPVDPAYHQHRPADLVHWAFIQWACHQGLDTFDFGTAAYEGQRRYKAKWGCEFLEYARYYLPVGNHCWTPAVTSSESRLFRVATATWRRAVPTRLTPLLGRHVYRLLGG